MTRQIAHAVIGIALLALCLVAPGAATGAKGPRIVAAAMLDSDRDAKADGIRLRYSKPIKHARDVDGKYPFAVAGYRIARVGAAAGKTLTLTLIEKAAPDPTAKPLVRYRATRLQPVSDRQGHQAVAQLFKAVKAHGHVVPTPPSPPSPPPAPDTDPDKDGYAAPADCKPNDAAIHPGAADRPDLGFIDSNCDGIDGDEANSVFVSTTGNNANPGTKAAPKRQPQAAYSALGKRRDILIARGGYDRLELLGVNAIGVGVYGGYDDGTWSRSSTGAPSQINGAPEGLLVVGTYDIVVQLLAVQGLPGGQFGNAYGIHTSNVQNGSSNRALLLQSVTVGTGAGIPGAAGEAGNAGAGGAPGEDGAAGGCDTGPPGNGGPGGTSPTGQDGGAGGRGGDEGRNDGLEGRPAGITPGGAGGKASPSNGAGYGGGEGGNGSNGVAGTKGPGGAGGDVAIGGWNAGNGGIGSKGSSGYGAGGGGGGGGQGGPFVNDGAGDGGGGGGGGGAPGSGGSGGIGGGGSFGLYLVSSKVTIEGGSIKAGAGGRGGDGGPGGIGGPGGTGGLGSTYCTSEVGAGGNGGAGGHGGDGGGGGGGPGGPSFGIFEISSPVAMKNVQITVSAGGEPGEPGIGGAGGTPAAAGASDRIVVRLDAP